MKTYRESAIERQEAARRERVRVRAPEVTRLHDLSMGLRLDAWEAINANFRLVLEGLQFALGEMAEAGTEIRPGQAEDAETLLMVALEGPFQPLEV